MSRTKRHHHKICKGPHREPGVRTASRAYVNSKAHQHRNELKAALRKRDDSLFNTCLQKARAFFVKFLSFKREPWMRKLEDLLSNYELPGAAQA